MSIVKHRLTIVWAVLMVATCVSTWGFSLHEFSGLVATVGVLVIAGVKIHLVMDNFMELRDGPIPIRFVYAAWIIVAIAVILGFYAVVH